MIAFKEWTLICDALDRGEQSLIIRKGGIAEGRNGFRFKHPEFLLFPTLFHEQISKLKVPVRIELPGVAPDGQHRIGLLANVTWTRDVTDWQKVRALAPFHLWQESEIEKRFRQDDQLSVSIAFVRVYRLSEPLSFPDSPRYGGCRSWVEVPDLPAETRLELVLNPSASEEREQQILNALD
jgi:hypothetical protein